jgi:hypothetical protein
MATAPRVARLRVVEHCLRLGEICLGLGSVRLDAWACESVPRHPLSDIQDIYTRETRRRVRMATAPRFARLRLVERRLGFGKICFRLGNVRLDAWACESVPHQPFVRLHDYLYRRDEAAWKWLQR